MKSADRQKMCANCNARASLEATECPYCAEEFPEMIDKSTQQAPSFKPHSLQESLASLYQPPYTTKPPEKKEAVESSVKKQVVYQDPPPLVAQSGVATTHSKERLQSDFWALFALIVGGNLLTLGLMQFFFSEKGVLRLEWDSSYWYLYCLIALPLFYLGFKKASVTLEEEL